MNINELQTRLREREADITLLQNTFGEIGTLFDLQKLYQVVAERARELIQAETLLIPILDSNCETYTYRGAAGKNATEIVNESLPLDFGICGWVWRNKRSWWRGTLNELTDEERNLWEKEAGSVILVPLQGPTHFLGGIAGINKQGARDFDERDLNLLMLFANVVSIAIENAMVVDEISEARELMTDYQARLERMNRQLSDSNRELEFMSLYDPITTLPNRSLFHDRLTQNIAACIRHKSILSVLLIDLNNFKHINETLGHEQGDMLLKQIAQRLNACLDENETFSRLGGDEFILIVPKANETMALERARFLLSMLDPPFQIRNTDIIIGASIGIAAYPQHGHDTSTLMRHADIAMYTAKQNKRGVVLYNPEEDHSSLTQLTLSTDLRKAFEEQQFELHYQPKINIKTGKLVGAEALGRWRHPIRGYIPPAIFIDALEQSGQIDRYTNWAIEVALKQAIYWREQGQLIKIAVNISTMTLMNPMFLHDLHKLVTNTNNGELLIFEITENLFLSEYDRLAETLALIHSLGIVLSIDDFGTGYSSLSRLKKLPVSELKIDRSFISEMTRNSDDEVIVRSTIELAHNLGLTVTAEGVETNDSYLRLVELGCDLVQGYLISKPLPQSEFENFVIARSKLT
jgi:diguanylate cyclase (GGDEF)-like protein